MRKLVIIFLLVCLVLAKANSGFVLLKIYTEPISAGLAGCEYLKKDNHSALQYNPAALANKDRTLFSAGYSNYLSDGQTGFIGAGTDTGFGNLGLDISWLNMGKFEGRENPSDQPQYEFDAGYMNFSAGYAYSFFDKLQIGISGKYLVEKIEFEQAEGYAVSSGIKIIDLPKNSSFSVSVQNIGKMNKLYQTATLLPSSIETGAGYNVVMSDFEIFKNSEGSFFIEQLAEFNFFAALKSNYLLEDKKNLINCGLEIGYQNLFFLRGGYRFDNEGLPFTLGFGLNYSGFGFDYAFSNFQEDFGQIHSFSLSYNIK